MRIAVTGTHGVGKTTLVEDFVEAFPRFAREQEPYWALVQQGVAFAGGATVGDLEQQLKASCEMILAVEAEDVVFDRCPFDYVAYLEVVAGGEGFEWEPSGRLLSQMDAAVAALDAIAFVPMVEPDEITVAIEEPRLRGRVDRRLKRMLRKDELGLLAEGPKLVEVTGDRALRVEKLAVALGLAEASVPAKYRRVAGPGGSAAYLTEAEFAAAVAAIAADRQWHDGLLGAMQAAYRVDSEDHHVPHEVGLVFDLLKRLTGREDSFHLAIDFVAEYVARYGVVPPSRLR